MKGQIRRKTPDGEGTAAAEGNLISSAKYHTSSAQPHRFKYHAYMPASYEGTHEPRIHPDVSEDIDVVEYLSTYRVNSTYIDCATNINMVECSSFACPFSSLLHPLPRI